MVLAKFLKRHPVFFVFILLIGGAASFIIFAILWDYFSLPTRLASYNTIYAKNYSDENFDQIKEGMTKNEVIDLIGTPLGPVVPYSEPYMKECFGYAWERNLPFFIGEMWMNYHHIGVCYGDDGKVGLKYSDILWY